MSPDNMDGVVSRVRADHYQISTELAMERQRYRLLYSVKCPATLSAMRRITLILTFVLKRCTEICVGVGGSVVLRGLRLVKAWGFH